MSTKKMWIANGLLAAAGFAGAFALAVHQADPGPMSRAAWAFKAENPRQLVTHADAIVVARVAAVDDAWRIATSDNGEDTLPYQLVELQVLRSLKGGASGTLQLERAGGFDPVDQVRVRIDADGGELELGHDYLLFLKQQPGTGLWYQANDQARYEVVDGRLAAIDPDDDPVQSTFHRRPVEQAAALIAQAAGG